MTEQPSSNGIHDRVMAVVCEAHDEVGNGPIVGEYALAVGTNPFGAPTIALCLHTSSTNLGAVSTSVESAVTRAFPDYFLHLNVHWEAPGSVGQEEPQPNPAPKPDPMPKNHIYISGFPPMN